MGAFAVVLSLLYAGYQIQLNTAERRDSSIPAITERDEQIALIHEKDEAAREAWSKVLRTEELELTDLRVMGGHDIRAP
jgi:hypothetical protein